MLWAASDQINTIQIISLNNKLNNHKNNMLKLVNKKKIDLYEGLSAT